MLRYIASGAAWTGERIGGIAYPPSIEVLWSDAELATVGLERAPAASPPIETLRETRIAATYAKMLALVDGGVVSVTTSAGTHDYGTDFRTQDNIAKALLGVLGDITPDPRPWTPKGATAPVSLTHDDVVLVAGAIGDRYDAHVQAYLAHKAAITALSEAADITAYDIDIGWPD